MIDRVALIGLMATGKSTLGRALAQHLGWTFSDIDDVIVDATGHTVRELWEREGEEGYRPREAAAVLEALTTAEPVVVAVPAGAVLEAEVADALTDRSVLVIWLDATPATLAARVGSDDHRPLLGSDPLAVLTEMAADRRDRYQALADDVIEIDHMDMEALVQAGTAIVERVRLPRPDDT
ncbi:MAG: shikimate kinase [Acidimicrobiales bacterium]|nr:shikimate kinase [Acidimicrobiales bacterium]